MITRYTDGKYNSYVIEGTKMKVVIDPCAAVPDMAVNYVICNRASADCFEDIIRIVDNRETIVLGSADSIGFLKEYTGREFRSNAIVGEIELDLGNINLRCMAVDNINRRKHLTRSRRLQDKFRQLPNFGWIDSVAVYCQEEHTLFTCDTFVGWPEPYKEYIAKFIDRISNLAIDNIMMGSGEPVRTVQEVTALMNQYREWSQILTRRDMAAAIVYASNYGQTRRIATMVRDTLVVSGLNAQIFNIEDYEGREDQLARIISNYKGLIIGTTTAEGDVPDIIKVLLANIPKRYVTGAIGAVFSVFAYDGEGADLVQGWMEAMGMAMLGDPVKVKIKADRSDEAYIKRFFAGYASYILTGNRPVIDSKQESQETACCKDSEQTYVIIGNGAAGISACEEIRKYDSTGRIHIIAAEGEIAYNRQMLARGIMSEIRPQNMHLHESSWYEDNDIEVEYNARVTDIDIANHTILTSTNMQLQYSKLVIATGSDPVMPKVDGMRLQGVYCLHDIEEVNHMRSYIENRNASKCVIVGGGILSLETAWTLKQAGLEVTIVEASDYLMPRHLDYETASYLERTVMQGGSNVRCGVQIMEIQGDGCVNKVLLNDGGIIAADLIIFCCGVTPQADIARRCGIESGTRGISVDKYMHTSTTDVYACGDCADCGGINYRLWSDAVSMGRIAGANACGVVMEYSEQIPPFIFNGYGISVFSIGRIEQYEAVKSYVNVSKGSFEKMYFYKNRLCGCILVNEIDSIAEIIEAVNKNKTADEIKL